MTAQRKKKNHFTPASYLAGFTPSGDQDDRIYQHDLASSREPARLKPCNAGFERYLYLASEPGLPVNAMEDWFEKHIETPASKVFKAILRKEELPRPNTSEFAKVLRFVAFMLVRVPKVRAELFQVFEEHWTKKLSKEMTCKEDFDRWKRSTALQDLQETYEDVVRGIKSGGLKLHFKNDRFIKEMFVLVEQLRPSLVRRKWSLLIAEVDAEHFITSDNPAVMVLDRGCEKPEDWSLESPEVVLRFPLNRRMALEARIGGDAKGRRVEDSEVAIFNGFVGMAANKFVYSTLPKFRVAPDKPNPNLFPRETLLEDWREKRAGNVTTSKGERVDGAQSPS